MTIEEIKELLQLFNESGVAEFELQRGDNRLRLRRAGVNREDREYSMPMPTHSAPPEGVSYPQTPHLTGASTATPAAAAPKAPETESGDQLVKSPIVGTYYDAPSPGAPQFVRVGDTVEPGQILCIIESMKLMNEIEAEVPGVIAAKLVENGRPVEYGEALFAIRPR